MLTSEIEKTGRCYLRKIISRYLILSGWALLQCATRSTPHREMGKPLSSKTIRRGAMTLLTGRIRWVSGSLKMVSQAKSRRRIGIRYRNISSKSTINRRPPLSADDVVALVAAGHSLHRSSHRGGTYTRLSRFRARDAAAWRRVAEDRVIGASAATRGRSSHCAGGNAEGCAGQAGDGSVRAAEATIFGE